MGFIAREQDLAFFERCYKNRKAQLVVLYGRRRVGKTSCLREFAKDKPHVWYSCTKDTDAIQVRRLAQRISARLPETVRTLGGIDSWERALRSIPQLDMPGRKLVILDEFPYAVASNKALPSIMQNVWDELLSHEDVMIVLSGSSIGFMEDDLLGEGNPLYGRATGIWKMEPLSYSDAVKFFPSYTPQQKLEAYGILGGIPYYLEQFDPDEDIRTNVCDYVLARGCPLYTEVNFLLREELQEPSTYNAVLDAVAAGETQLGKIAQKGMLDTSSANTYLRRLESLRILEREFSVQMGAQERTKKGRGLWRVNDNYVRFWYAAVAPYVSELDQGDVEGVWEHVIAPNINDLLSRPFEDVCRQWVRRRNIEGDLPFRYRVLGRWWQDANEIDIVALGDRATHLLGECKFWKEPVGASVLSELEDKQESFFREGDGYLYLFAKNGFIDGGAFADGNPKIHLVEAEQLEG